MDRFRREKNCQRLPQTSRGSGGGGTREINNVPFSEHRADSVLSEIGTCT